MTAATKDVEVSVPPGPLGLLLNSGITHKAIVQGFAPLPDGSKGPLELHADIHPGCQLIAVNGNDLSEKSLVDISSILRETSSQNRRFRFRMVLAESKREVPTSASAPTAVPPVVSNPEPSPSNDNDRIHLLKTGGDGEKIPDSSTSCVSPEDPTEPDPFPHTALPRLSVVDKAERERVNEVKAILRHDKRKVERGECWFLVPTAWINDWIQYAAKKGANPGPVCTSSLLKEGWENRLNGVDVGAYDEPREGLRLMKDYRGVTPLVWCLFVELYGIGKAPPVSRFELDIYKKGLLMNEYETILQSPRLKALLIVKEIKSTHRKQDERRGLNLHSKTREEEEDDLFGGGICSCFGF